MNLNEISYIIKNCNRYYINLEESLYKLYEENIILFNEIYKTEDDIFKYDYEQVDCFIEMSSYKNWAMTDYFLEKKPSEWNKDDVNEYINKYEIMNRVFDEKNENIGNVFFENFFHLTSKEMISIEKIMKIDEEFGKDVLGLLMDIKLKFDYKNEYIENLSKIIELYKPENKDFYKYKFDKLKENIYIEELGFEINDNKDISNFIKKIIDKQYKYKNNLAMCLDISKQQMSKLIDRLDANAGITTGSLIRILNETGYKLIIKKSDKE